MPSMRGSVKPCGVVFCELTHWREFPAAPDRQPITLCGYSSDWDEEFGSAVDCPECFQALAEMVVERCDQM